ncbi:DUF4276 family protein [Frankia sp. CNm7]|uniref:DUF4276 family protein n=1 Tax=Frankia nepalensis TaxID=1836974 RepID=A0A937USZ7_9ACTN|nr:DUF4276 family protein [Frankia nepalensis]MBL7497324.1 DUF4276 family protein [Frankia nepalensis]MBL7509719.1 DUF4276 family protein [Frankia nepalensis]MBL7516933.1 DUF4276 family protein [Frankia nepalensis]MBL7629446.1 DUF4276 family protein [Frankia nepalensis]
MTPLRIATIVEGQGEVAAVPVLLRRIAAELAPEVWLELPRPHRVSRPTVVGKDGLESVLAVVAEQVDQADGVLVLLDADDDCPAALGPSLLARSQICRPDRRVSVVIANREFEAWFLAAAASLAGRRGLRTDLTTPADPERRRDCKGWLSAHRTDGHAYKPQVEPAPCRRLRGEHGAARNHRGTVTGNYRHRASKV